LLPRVDEDLGGADVLINNARVDTARAAYVGAACRAAPDGRGDLLGGMTATEYSSTSCATAAAIS
jgi:hypothetical protein